MVSRGLPLHENKSYLIVFNAVKLTNIGHLKTAWVIPFVSLLFLSMNSVKSSKEEHCDAQYIEQYTCTVICTEKIKTERK